MIGSSIDNIRKWTRMFAGGLIVALYLLISFALVEDWPPPWPDEVFFGEPASVLARTGELRSEVILGMERHVYWQPPGFFLFLAGAISLVGYNLVSLRALSILTGAVVLWCAYLVAFQITRKKGVSLLGMGLLALNPNFVTYAKLVRMDGICMLLELVAFLVVLRAGGSFSKTRLFVTGCLLALAVMFHPLGAIGFVVVVGYLWSGLPTSSRERFLAMAVLLMPLIAGLAVFGAYAASDPGSFGNQIGMQLERKMRPFWEPIGSFTLRYRTLPAFVLLVCGAMLLWIRYRLWRHSRAHSAVMIWVLAALVCVALTFEGAYHLHLLPVVSLSVALAAAELWSSGARLVRNLAVATLLFAAVNFVAYSSFFVLLYRGPSSRPLTYNQLFDQAGKVLPAGAKVLLMGPPDGYWHFRQDRTDLRLIESVVLSGREGAILRNTATHVVIGRAFEPTSDSTRLFGDLRRMVLNGKDSAWFRIIAYVGERKAFHPGVWVVELKRMSGGALNAVSPLPLFEKETAGHAPATVAGASDPIHVALLE
jgi:hypothetical protein